MGYQGALIVDECATDAVAIRDLVTEYEIPAKVARTAEHALLEFSRTRPAFLFVHLNLPGAIDGWELLEVLNQEGYLDHTLAVALTAHDYPEVEETALAEGFAAYLTKPLDAERVQQTLEDLLPVRVSAVG
jgi:CheY-like chemotaxis protein